MDGIILGLNGVPAKQVDVTIFGATGEERDSRFKSVLIHLIQRAVHIKATERKFGASELKFPVSKIFYRLPTPLWG